MKDCLRRKIIFSFYFAFWVSLALLSIILNILNMDWSSTNIANGVFIILILSILQGFVLEFPVQAIFSLLLRKKQRHVRHDSDISNISVIMNYNLLATTKEDIENCMQTMFTAYMGNIGKKTSIVLVSATKDEELRDFEIEKRDYYRSLIYDELYSEGIYLARHQYSQIHTVRFLNVWRHYRKFNPALFTSRYLHGLCLQFSNKFMVIHRQSHVLRKCGQYQDLMLLSEGHTKAKTYCDEEYYKQSARTLDEDLFESSCDVDQIVGQKFDYTFVLDGDTEVPEGAVVSLTRIAMTNPDRGIIQPAIKLVSHKCDTIFMHLETLRQMMSEHMSTAISEVFQQCSFYGKAFINNKIYIENVLIKDGQLLERVPVDVLSHDTFEASILRPLYAPNVCLVEAPSYNYVTWNIRERRWNRGEIINAMYFWPRVVGRPIRCLQKLVQGKKYLNAKLRTKTKRGFTSSFLAHAALRQMFMKPLLLLYIVFQWHLSLHFPYLPICIIMFLVVIFPKIAMCSCKNFKFVVLEITASVFQFTPEAVVGCVRIARAFHATVFAGVAWIPQSSVENEFKQKNPLLSACKHLWGYSLLGLLCLVGVLAFSDSASNPTVYIMVLSLIVLPIFTGLTSLPVGCFGRYRGRVGVASHTSMHPSNNYALSDSVCPSRLAFQSEKSKFAWGTGHDAGASNI